MPSASYVQTNFTGGEVSTAYAERTDEQDYKTCLALSLNYVPTQTGALWPRSGFKRCGNTKFNEVPKLLSFKFSTQEPYVACITENNIRLFSLGLPIFDGAQNVNPVDVGAGRLGYISSISGDPPTFTFDSPVPVNWQEGDSIYVRPWLGSGGSAISDYAAAMNSAPHLFNKEFVLSDLDTVAKTCTLTDAVTGDPLTGTITLSAGNLQFVRILDIAAPYPTVDNIRLVEHTDQTVTIDPNTKAFTVSAPDQRATFLHNVVSPRSFSYAQSIQPSPDNTNFSTNQNLALLTEQFIDGPYLDSWGTGIPMTVSGTTGTITVRFHQWNTNTRYMKGDLALDYTQDPTGDPYYYMSLIDNNVGNALPANAATGAINANWVQLNIQRKMWSSGTTYQVGQAVSITSGGTFQVPVNELPIYYSKIAANLNHAPATSPTQWGTTPPVYSGAVTYSKGAIVTESSVAYVSIANANTGNTPSTDAGVHWVLLPKSIEDATVAITDINDGWLKGPLFTVDDAGGSASTIGQGFLTDNPGRVFRLKWAPQPWNNKWTYAANDLVTFNDNIFKSLAASNTGNQPDQDATNWEIQTQTILWTWGRIVDASVHMFQADIELIGPDLPSNIPVWEFRFGVYSDTTGWPTNGGFHEGRLWLAGVTPNRFDAGAPNQGFNFAPTAPDGTVSDGNAISYTLNSKRRETILATSSITEGVQLATDNAEWLVAASALNDPITPTSVQAHPTTKWGAYPNDATEIPTGLVLIQRGGRRVMEYRNFIDQVSYQARMNALDLTRKCQHLTIGGVGETAYQSLSQPVVWVCPQDLTNITWLPTKTAVCPILSPGPNIVTQQPETADLFGISYMRAPDVSYEAPFSYEHGLTYYDPTSPAIVKNIAVQDYYLPGQENLYIALEDWNGYTYIEMLMPFTESKVIGPDNPLQIKTDGNGLGNVFTYGIHDSDFMLDSGVTPSGCKIASDGLSVTFYGLYPHIGASGIVMTCMGQELATDVEVEDDGTATITFTDDFTFVLLQEAANHWPQWLPGATTVQDPGASNAGKNNLVPKAYFCPFSFDPNGNSAYWGSTAHLFEGIFCQFGYRYRRRGKMLRPIVGGQNGPSFAKITQNSRAGISVDAAQEISAGATFNPATDIDGLQVLTLTKNGDKDITPLGSDDFVTGRVRDFIKDDYSFNGQICFEQTKAVAGGVLAVGGFDAVEDV